MYEYGTNSGENAVPTYSYTYSYTHISSCFLNVGSSQMLNLVPFDPAPAANCFENWPQDIAVRNRLKAAKDWGRRHSEAETTREPAPQGRMEKRHRPRMAHTPSLWDADMQEIETVSVIATGAMCK